MKNKLLVLLAAFTLCISCSDDGDALPQNAACDVDNPVDDLDWLRTLVNTIKDDESNIANSFYIQMATFDNAPVFLQNNCCTICNTVVPIYNCQGESLGFLGGEIKPADLSDQRIIFERDDSTCFQD